MKRPDQKILYLDQLSQINLLLYKPINFRIKIFSRAICTGDKLKALATGWQIVYERKILSLYSKKSQNIA